ncbi:MAG TPA: SprT family zinc-dependent metalloprotease [Accumulibacter sp.]|nr:SprT family zinc-dependent metalloprotease [Accumulibacter sp.]HMW17595.1 SprT family zinc-dependent metalloprotease [Accumulibacter sp.]HMX21555.1 SprT family zinc-dependent metalloprotease [Accumulibacter sp.]HMY07226.1 SprT family zinc-dependent metalloprotease [Accumulibacter sp.]HNC17311.1 SprT family zinc-dependent metalloprotease [Accumulibacter sp.]
MPSAEAQTPAEGERLRTVALGQTDVTYFLRRSKRKTIGLSIDHRGLRVGAPPRATLLEIENLLQRHATWIIDKLALWRQRTPPAEPRIVDGLRLPVLGEPIVVRLAPGAQRSRWNAQYDQLTLGLRDEADAPRRLEAALRGYARHVFLQRLAHYAERLTLPVPPLALSSARTRWGSCNSRGIIRLNWRLIHFPLPLIDYVVIHELAHLREMNHGPRFWSIVADVCPDYQAARQQLRQQAALYPQWSLNQGEHS